MIGDVSRYLTSCLVTYHVMSQLHCEMIRYVLSRYVTITSCTSRYVAAQLYTLLLFILLSVIN
jgi:hypothetical protein